MLTGKGPPFRRRLRVQGARKRSPMTHRHLDSAVLSGFSVGAGVSLQGLASQVVFTGPSAPRGGGEGAGWVRVGVRHPRKDVHLNSKRKRSSSHNTSVSMCLLSVKPQ